MSSVNEAINHRRLGALGVAAKLDQLSVEEVVAMLGPSDHERREYAEASPIRIEPKPAPMRVAWSVGDQRPALATDDPAEVVAMNLCVLARTPVIVTSLGATLSHPTDCGWCGYPVLELHRAIAHALYFSRHVTTHLLVWVGVDGGEYLRPGDEDGRYQNPRWAAMAALHQGEQRRRVQRVTDAIREDS